jgi:hypothetical protein
MIAENDKYILTVEQDLYPESPREWDNLGTMVCWHRRYDLGDKHTYSDTDEMYGDLYRQFVGEEPEQYDHETDKDFAKRITDKVNEYIVILPLYLYDHSGISMSTSRTYPFDCRWDSMQVGWIYVKKGTEETEKFTDDELYEILIGEVETYNRFLVGDIVSFVLEEKKHCDCCGNYKLELVDSCCGFYDIKDIVDCLPDDAKHLVDEL